MAMNKLMVGIMGLVIMSKLDLDNRELVNQIRLGYVLSCAYCSIGYYWIYSKITSKNDQTEVILSPGRDDQPAKKTTKHEYDMGQLAEMFQSYAFGLLMMGVLHFQLGENRLLFFQAILNPFMTVECPLFRIHLLGESDGHGDLERPWKPTGLFGSSSAPAIKPAPPASMVAAQETPASASGGGSEAGEMDCQALSGGSSHGAGLDTCESDAAKRD